MKQTLWKLSPLFFIASLAFAADATRPAPVRFSAAGKVLNAKNVKTLAMDLARLKELLQATSERARILTARLETLKSLKKKQLALNKKAGARGLASQEKNISKIDEMQEATQVQLGQAKAREADEEKQLSELAKRLSLAERSAN